MNLPALHPRAERDLEEIWDHIATDRLAAADDVIARIFDAIEMIGLWPGVGKRRDDLGRRALQTYTTSDGFTIVYTSETNPIRILRVSGRGRDLEALLEEEG